MACVSSVLAAPACFDFTVPVNVQAQSLQPAFPPFNSHYESVAFLNQITGRSSGNPFLPDLKTIQVSVNIAGQVCVPAKVTSSTLQILSHGIGFDRSYWNFNGINSNYSYVKAATDAGYMTLAYDRIGTGLSSKPDPYTVTEVGIEAEILKFLTDLVRNKTASCFRTLPTFSKIVHVGHSYGSLMIDAMVAKYPNIADGIILTGFSNNLTYEGAFAISSDFHLARENQPARFGGLNNGYLTWGDELSNQYGFFYYPYFSTDVLAKSEATKWPFGISALLTASVTSAPSYSKPVLVSPYVSQLDRSSLTIVTQVLSGQQDRIFCGSDCGGGFLDSSRDLFPSAKIFQTYVQPNTGHGINLHYNATGAYGVTINFIRSNIG